MKKEKLIAGTIKDHYQIAFLSDEQTANLNLDQDYLCDMHADVFEIMDAQIFKAINMDLQDQPEEYYLDISVDLENQTFQVHDIYEATYGTYGIIIESNLNLQVLPITLPLLDEVKAILKL